MLKQSDDLKELIGSRLILGFHGLNPDDESIKSFTDVLLSHHIGGIIFFKYNIKHPQQTIELNKHFKTLPLDSSLLICIDQEGGKVQRLSAQNGHQDFYSAHDVAQNFSPEQAYQHYCDMAQVTSGAGFNVSFGPVVDFSHDKKSGHQSPVIGALQRAYGPSVDKILPYAQAYIEAHHRYNVHTCIKHFPGHGLSQADSHKGLTDITSSFNRTELDPFYALCERKKADMVMSAHLINKNIDPHHPASLSRDTLQQLLRVKGYDGVVITDDLMMGAIKQHYGFADSITKAMHATNDLIILSDNPLAYSVLMEGTQTLLHHSLLDDLFHHIEQEIVQGNLLESEMLKSYERIQQLKNKKI